jgi:N-acetylglucosaminyldiphosphoundecaprenol N-acetyl-beta-D-mannosaminyltransferase
MNVRGVPAHGAGRGDGLHESPAEVQSDAGLADVIDLTQEVDAAVDLSQMIDLEPTATDEAPPAAVPLVDAIDLADAAEAVDLEEAAAPEVLDLEEVAAPITLPRPSDWLANPGPVVRERILGHRVDVVDLDSAVEMIVRRARVTGGGSYVCCSNVHATVEGNSDQELRDAAERAFLSVPDGMPLTWILKHRGHRAERVSGTELALRVTADGVTHGLRHFFLGGAPGIPERVAEALSAEAPGMEIAGCFSPPFASDGGTEVPELKNMIAETQPDVVWVALGCPKQELWMARNAAVLGVPVMVGIGAAFDFLAGEKKRAPRWMQRTGLEWFFRLTCEPRRLWRRYLIGNSKFVRLLLTDALFNSFGRRQPGER